MFQPIVKVIMYINNKAVNGYKNMFVLCRIGKPETRPLISTKSGWN